MRPTWPWPEFGILADELAQSETPSTPRDSGVVERCGPPHHQGVYGLVALGWLVYGRGGSLIQTSAPRSPPEQGRSPAALLGRRVTTLLRVRGRCRRGRLATVLPETHRLGEFSASSRVAGGDHGVTDRQAPLRTVLLRRESASHQMPS